MAPELIAFIGTVIGALIGASVGLITGWLAWKQFKKERIDRLKQIASEKRLLVYQEAYRKWIDLMWALPKNKEDAGAVAYECQQWWYKNCLYLSSRTRDSFKYTCNVVSWYNDLTDLKDRVKYRKEVEETGRFIVEDVDLPPLTDADIERIVEDRNG